MKRELMMSLPLLFIISIDFSSNTLAPWKEVLRKALIFSSVSSPHSLLAASACLMLLISRMRLPNSRSRSDTFTLNFFFACPHFWKNSISANIPTPISTTSDLTQAATSHARSRQLSTSSGEATERWRQRGAQQSAMGKRKNLSRASRISMTSGLGRAFSRYATNRCRFWSSWMNSGLFLKHPSANRLSNSFSIYYYLPPTQIVPRAAEGVRMSSYKFANSGEQCMEREGFSRVLQFRLVEMSMLSVLEEEDGGASELLRCKLNYLQAENAWMHQEYASLCKLVDLQKQLIHAEPSALPDIAAHLAEVLALREQELQAARERAEGPPAEAQAGLELEEFVPFIYSFEEKIERLQKEIKSREATLQQIEQAKLAEPDHRPPEFKSIAAYDSQARLLDRVKREIAAQQARKQRLENELLALAEKGEEESTVASQGQSRGRPPAAEEQASAFERVIVLLKKKRFQNGCLEEKAGRLRRAVEQKRTASSRLRSEIEGLEWNCLEGLVGAGGFVEAEKGDLSLAGRSFSANNASFSFDVSRFIRPKQHFRTVQA